jgi:FkbM family methyltransferase
MRGDMLKFIRGITGRPSSRAYQGDAMFENFRPISRPIFPLRNIGIHRRVKNEALIRGLTRAAYIGDHVSLCYVLGRYKMYVDTRDVTISSHLMLDGFWEMWVTEAMVDLVRPGMVVADIGANLGYFTMLMSDLVGPKGRVHAFEPNPEMTKRLRSSIIVNGFTGRAELHQVLLGNADGEQMAFHVDPAAPGGGYMTSLAAAAGLPEASILETCRLDSRPEWRNIEFAKIDVEGAESVVWDGAEGLLEQATLKTVFMEFMSGRYSDAAGFLDRIVARGFSLSMVVPDRGIRAVTREHLLGDGANQEFMLVLRR